MMSRGGESIEVEKREITATTATTRMDEELDEERRDVNDENENNTPLSVNDFDFRAVVRTRRKQTKAQTKKEIERAILSMESRTRKNARELSDTQESLEKFKGKKPDVVLKFLSN